MKCDYCGRFMSYADFDAGIAVYKMTQPDSEFGPEEYEGYHVACRKAAMEAKR